MTTATGDRKLMCTDAWRTRRPGVGPAVPLLVLMLACAGVQGAIGAVIPVTAVQQKISDAGGCSLQEAIYSANFDDNVAISGYSGSTPVEVVTQCVPGSGDDVIVLPAGALLQLSNIIDDADNPAGTTATPIITSNITILAYGATLERIGGRNFRLFTVASSGHLTIRRAYIRGFRSQGGNGGEGGGGGMGAGGAIYVMAGGLAVEASTFENNVALGGTGGGGESGGGGGMGGHGGITRTGCQGGAGGGGARGSGGQCSYDPLHGGGGGGTVSNAPNSPAPPALGGFACGGNGGHSASGQSAPCPGGGGGGGGEDLFQNESNHGGTGSYGGGGGGGAWLGGGNGGRGGFGGGGGASGTAGGFGEDGGNGGFGGGGGVGANGFVTDGDPGNGGFFAGNGNGSGGGGGAGFGGAIFNDGGSVDIRNSTFTLNGVGGGFSQKSQDGSGGGGAIFSRNGHLTVLNSTISGNLANFGGGIIVAQDAQSAATSFVLQNTILSNNGLYECAISGFSVAVAFAGNLIQSPATNGIEYHRETFVGCEGVVTTSDAQLGPLQYNQGATPTMAIASTSPAWNAADPTTSLPVDQRRQPRPANGGFDIGAFELCLEGSGNLEHPCLIVAGIEDPGGSGQAVELTIEVAPSGAGTTIPAQGVQEVAIDSVVFLKATPNPGFRFTDWSPNVTSPSQPSTTVFMDALQVVTANFAACDCASEVSGSIGIARGRMTRPYVQTVRLTNNSADTIRGPVSLVLDDLTAGVKLTNADGKTLFMVPADSPYVDFAGDLVPGQIVVLPLRFTNPGGSDITYSTRVLAGPGSR